jgi:hypothetical protein
VGSGKAATLEGATNGYEAVAGASQDTARSTLDFELQSPVSHTFTAN